MQKNHDFQYSGLIHIIGHYDKNQVKWNKPGLKIHPILLLFIQNFVYYFV
jgi:hypothetical protein